MDCPQSSHAGHPGTTATLSSESSPNTKSGAPKVGTPGTIRSNEQSPHSDQLRQALHTGSGVSTSVRPEHPEPASMHHAPESSDALTRGRTGPSSAAGLVRPARLQQRAARTDPARQPRAGRRPLVCGRGPPPKGTADGKDACRAACRATMTGGRISA